MSVFHCITIHKLSLNNTWFWYASTDIFSSLILLHSVFVGLAVLVNHMVFVYLSPLCLSVTDVPWQTGRS